MSYDVVTEKAQKRFNRSKDGCLTCRFYRKGCDKEKPICKRCRWPAPLMPIRRPPKRHYTNQSPTPFVPDSQPCSSEAIIDVLPDPHSLGEAADSNALDRAWVDPLFSGSESGFDHLLDEFIAAPTNSEYPITSFVHLGDLSSNDWCAVEPSRQLKLTQTSPLASTTGNQTGLKLYIRALLPWIGANPKVVAAFDKYIRRIWTGQDECSLALQSSAEAAGTAFIQSCTDMEAEDLNYARKYHRDIRSKAAAISDEVLVKPEVPFSVKLTVLLELATYEFFTHGALSYLRVISLAEDVVLTIHPRGSQINLRSIRGTENYGLANYVWADVCRSITNLMPPSFHYVNEKTTSTISESEDVQGLEYMNGCPDEITVILAQISHLSSTLDYCLHHRGLHLPPIYKEKAEAIASDITKFSISTHGLNTSDGVMNVARVARQEIWRQTALIHLYISVYQRGPLFRPLKEALSQMLKLFSIIETGLPILLRGTLPLPLFLTATIAISEEARHTCHNYMVKAAGATGALNDGIHIIEQCWKETDETGEFTSWRSIARNGGGQLAFL